MTLSIIIASRNEMFLNRTIESLLENIEGETDIIVVLDGQWEDIPIHDKVTVVYNPVSVGQRASCNQAVKMSNAKYIMKVDAHCSFDKGFDRIMMEDMQNNWTMVPIMKNLHAFDWVCENGHRRYQGPSGVCAECGLPTVMDILWFGKPSPQSTSYCFNEEPKFQYFGEYCKTQEYKDALKTQLTETMSLQGSAFMLTREKYWELDICSESFPSWGSQGLEVAIRTWLSGGRVVVNHRTWYAHMFRTQGGDFSFPYPQSGRSIDAAKAYAKRLFFDNRWEGQTLPLSWLIEKFNPPYWTPESRERLKKWPLRNQNIIYYTCNTQKEKIKQGCRQQLKKPDLKIISISLNKDIDFGDIKLVYKGERGILAMHKQILMGLKASKAAVVFLCEHDVLYHPTHFDFIPEHKNVIYYNTNVWRMRYDDGHMIWTDDLQQVSGVCAYRELLIDHYEKKVKQIEGGDFDGHYEPGVKQSIAQYNVENWQSAYPNICIRHGGNLTKSKWRKEDFRNQKYTIGWKEADALEGWDNILTLIK